MPGVISAAISLEPDWTLFVQLGVFLCTLAALDRFIFRPVLRIMDERKRFTEGARATAARLTAEADELDEERRRRTHAAIKDADGIRSGELAAAEAEAARVIETSRAECKRLLDSTEMSIEVSEGSVEKRMQEEAEALSEEIVSRVTGRTGTR